MKDHSPLAWTRRALFGILASLSACSGGGGDGSNSGLDTEPPMPGNVADGLGADIDSQSSTSTISANWTGFTDNSGEIASYDWAIGTTPGGTEIQPWTNVGAVSFATATGLALGSGTTCYVAVRAYDPSSNVSQPAISDGVTVMPGGGSGGGSGSASTLAASVSQWGITWRFAEPELCGQFCNGDWWVVGPVQVVEITPATTVVGGRTINGSMVNPVPDGVHGYDSTLYHPYENGTYHANLNAAIGVSETSPLQLAPGSSMISVESQLTAAANGSFSQLKTAAVLTVLAAEPPADAFRPPYAGTDKTIRFRESDLDFNVLPGIAAVGSTPDLNATAAQFQRVWLDHCPGWGSRFMHPVENMPDYGRDFTSLIGTGLLLAQLDFTNAQKRDLVVRLVQIGIDHFGNVQNGCFWPGEGGHGSGRKFPILFAGRLLHDAAMQNLGATHPSVYYGPGNGQNQAHFGEDCQTFRVAETSPGVYDWGYGNYNASYVGMAEWGNSHATYPSNDHSDWMQDPYRRCCTGNAWVAQTLCARLMGLTTAWAHDEYFEYMDRFMQTETAGTWTRSWEPWQEQMWDHYRPLL